MLRKVRNEAFNSFSGKLLSQQHLHILRNCDIEYCSLEIEIILVIYPLSFSTSKHSANIKGFDVISPVKFERIFTEQNSSRDISVLLPRVSARFQRLEVVNLPKVEGNTTNTQ